MRIVCTLAATASLASAAMSENGTAVNLSEAANKGDTVWTYELGTAIESCSCRIGILRWARIIACRAPAATS